MEAVLQGSKETERAPPKKLRKKRSESKEEFEAKYMDVNRQFEPLISNDDDDDSDAGFVHQHIESDNGNEEINLINPANEQTVGSVISASKKDVDSAVESANNAFNSASNLSLEDKKQILQEVIDGMSNRRGDFAKVISEQMGAPLKMSSGAQYGSGVIHFKNTLSVIDDFKFQEIHDNITINKLPIGPVGMITPWNWPLNQMCTKIASAIAAGTSFVLKPSEITPGAAHILAEVIHDTSMPKGMFNLIHGHGATVGTEMSSHNGLEMISFTGSTRAGIDIQKKASENIK